MTRDLAAPLLALCMLAGPATAAPRPPPDHSLAPSEYIAQGIPAPDRAWSGDDYARAAERLKALAAQDRALLPRAGSPTSGALFRRMVARDNIYMAASPLLSDSTQLGGLSALMQGAAQVLSIYVDASATAMMDAELVDLTRFLLEAAAATAPIAAAVVAEVPADAPDRPARLQGMERMRQGFATMISGSLTTLTERDGYRTSELIRLAHALLATLPALLPYLPEGVLQELPVRIAAMAEGERDPALRARLERLLQLVQPEAGR